MKWCVPLLITAVHLTAAQKPGVITEYSTATLPLLNRTLDDVYRRIGDTTSGRARQAQWPSAVDRLTVYRQLDSLGYTFLATAMVGPGWTHASTDTLRVRGRSLFSGQVKIDGRLGVGVDPQDNSMVVVRQFSVPYAWRIDANPDPATNLYGIWCAGAWGTAGVWASNAYTAGYDMYGNSAGIGSVGIYTPLIAPRKDGTDRYVRISTAVAVDPHNDIGSGGTTVGLLDLRSSNKSTALYIEGSHTGITIASGRTVGINDSATYSRHQGYLLVDSSITTPLVGNGVSPFTAEGTSLTVRSGSRFIGINTSGIILSEGGDATNEAVRADRSVSTGNGLTGGGNLTANRTLSVVQGAGMTVNSGGVHINVATPFIGTMTWTGRHQFNAGLSAVGIISTGNVFMTASGSGGYWIDASTSYRWGMYRDASANLALRGNDAAVDGLVVCPSSVVSRVEFAAVNNSKVIVQASTQQVIGPTWTKVWFSSVIYDARNEYNVSSAQFTAPHTGAYQVNVALVFSSTWVPTVPLGWISVWVGDGSNSNRNWYQTFDISRTYNISAQISGLVYVNAGETIECRVNAPSSTNLTLSASGYDNKMSIHRVP